MYESNKAQSSNIDSAIRMRLDNLEQSIRGLTPAGVESRDGKKPAEGLEILKEIAGTGSYINPVTQRQEVMAFAQTFNSTRFEVSFFSTCLFCFCSDLF